MESSRWTILEAFVSWVSTTYIMVTNKTGYKIYLELKKIIMKLEYVIGYVSKLVNLL